VKTSVSGQKQNDFAFFDTAREPSSRVIALVDSMWVFLLLFYIVTSWNMPLFTAWSKDKLDKKFVVADNFVCIKVQALQTFSNAHGIRKYEK